MTGEADNECHRQNFPSISQNASRTDQKKKKCLCWKRNHSAETQSQKGSKTTTSCSSANRLKKCSNRTSKYFIFFCNPQRFCGALKKCPTPIASFVGINGVWYAFLCREYFERVMLTNSVIWQCSLTGRSDLTYAEALDSEKAARKLLRQFPSALRGPIILVASLTKRSTLKQLVDDVFSFVKDRYFKVCYYFRLKSKKFTFSCNFRMKKWMWSTKAGGAAASARLSRGSSPTITSK